MVRGMRLGVVIVVLAGIFTGYNLVFAQTGGQFCVRAFEDRNANGQFDAGEPTLTGGLGANLLDARGIIVASALLDDSPNAAQGVICFQFLAAGQYSMVITSADFKATTPSMMTVTVRENEPPTRFDFGGQRIASPMGVSAPETAAEDQTALLERIVIAALGALAVVLIMFVLGAIIYLLAYRGRLARAVPDPYMNPRVTTGSHPAVRTTDIGEYRRY